MSAEMKVRRLRPWELADTVPLAGEFHAAAKLGGEFDSGIFIDTMASLGESGRLGAIGLFCGDNLVGVLLGMIARHFLTDHLIAQEIMWWVTPDARNGSHGIRMVAEFEKWAKEFGASAVIMASFVETDGDDRLSAIYEHREYRKVETHFFKSWPSSRQQS